MIISVIHKHLSHERSPFIISSFRDSSRSLVAPIVKRVSNDSTVLQNEQVEALKEEPTQPIPRSSSFHISEEKRDSPSPVNTKPVVYREIGESYRLLLRSLPENEVIEPFQYNQDWKTTFHRKRRKIQSTDYRWVVTFLRDA